MFPPLLYLVFLFGLLLCFPLGVFPLPVLVPSRFMRKKETSKTELVFAKEGLFSKFLKIFLPSCTQFEGFRGQTRVEKYGIKRVIRKSREGAGGKQTVFAGRRPRRKNKGAF